MARTGIALCSTWWGVLRWIIGIVYRQDEMNLEKADSTINRYLSSREREEKRR